MPVIDPLKPIVATPVSLNERLWLLAAKEVARTINLAELDELNALCADFRARRSMNRREVLTGMALAGVAAAPAVAIAKSQPDRVAWDRAMDAYKRAYAASDAFDAELRRISDEYKAAIEHVPHVTFKSRYHGRPLSSADRHEVSPSHGMKPRTCATSRPAHTTA